MQPKLVKEYEEKQISVLGKDKHIEDFNSGDTVKVSVKIVDNNTERLQVFQGVVIGKRRAGINTSFRVRKISDGIGVERNFLLYSPLVNKIEILKRGVVRRAKLYYLRKLKGKAARIRTRLYSSNSSK